MGQKGEILRQRIVASADQLFYQQGYENTSFSDIAEDVGISRGNFYYHFKTKDEILNAVIDTRVTDIEQMLSEWGKQYTDPRERIGLFIDILTTHQDNITGHGCPIGSLCTELAKLSHTLLQDANKMFSIQRDWLTVQLRELGMGNEARQLAMYLLARTQGIAAIANAFEDKTFLRQEVKHLKQWLGKL